MYVLHASVLLHQMMLVLISAVMISISGTTAVPTWK